MWKLKEAYVLIAFFKDFEESGYLYPSEEFFIFNLSEVEKMKQELMESGEYEEIIISDEPVKREFWF